VKRSWEEINEKIAKGQAQVFTAEEAVAMAKESGPEEVLKKADIVTTGTFGAMCSSGVFINFGHPAPSIRMERVELGGVPLFGGIAAVDAYIGATEVSTDEPSYGGAHVIEALVRGESLRLRAWGKGTDCYPRREIDTWIDKDSVNEITMLNPRNAYQNYPAAVNSSDRFLYTYMGNLLPRMKNCNYSTSGELSPLLKDPDLRTIGTGTRIFLCGAVGTVAWNGTQFNTERARNAEGVPTLNARTLMVAGNLKEMDPRWLRAAYFEKYGVSLYVGIGIPIPVLDLDLARRVSLSNAEIETTVCDYALPDHAGLARVSYRDLRSGWIDIGGKKAKTAPLSSLAKAREIACELKARIASGVFPVYPPSMPLPPESSVRALEIKDKP
jgi:L-aspartate semialdehyde sulfurtransferase